MTRTTVQAGFDTWAGSAKPAQTHGDEKAIHVATGAEVGYVHFAVPAPRGSTVLSATLRLYAKGDSTGTRTLTARLITEAWKARTLNWNNRPSASNAGAVPITIHGLADKDPVEFDVTALVQAVVTGTSKNYGFSITTSGSDHKFYSAQSGLKPATLVVQYSERPAQPTHLRPGGGLVAVAQPTLQWDYAGGEDLIAYQIQADPGANEALPAYDSGQVAATDPIHALAGTSFDQLDVDGAATQWRVCVTDGGGDTSEWSDWVTVTRDDKGTLTLLNPAVAPNDYVSEPTPPILFTLTGEALAAFRVLITPATDRATIVHDSKKVAGTVGEYTLPMRRNNNGRGPKRPLIVSGQTYSVGVMAWDGKKRQGSAAAGDEPYAVVWRDFTMTDDAGVTAPALASVTQDGVTPAAALTFTRGTAPDSFVIVRDGVEIVAELDPIDVITTGTTYVWRDWSAHPAIEHEYQVRAVENGVQSQPSSMHYLAGGTKIDGVWVIDPATDRWFRCVAMGSSNNGVDGWAQVEVGTDYLPIDGQTGFRITQVLAGLVGTYEGALKPFGGRTVEEMATDLFAIKQDAPHAADFRLVADYLNIPVSLSELVCSVWEGRPVTGTRRRVSFALRQSGEFEFEGRV